jgi:hypothetical protein
MKDLGTLVGPSGVLCEGYAANSSGDFCLKAGIM